MITYGNHSLKIVDFLFATSAGLQVTNNSLRAAYITLRTTLESVQKQTEDLPDVQGNFKATDDKIAKTFKQIHDIQQDSRSGEIVSQKLKDQAQIQN